MPLLGVVYVLRFIAGPIIDRDRPSGKGPYRRWLWTTRAGLAASLAALSLIEPAHDLPLLVAGVTILLVFAALNDTATNGLAVRILEPSERGLGNGIQVACATASIVLGTGGALLLYDLWGWRATLLLLAAFFILPAAMLIGFQEPTGTTPSAIQWSRIHTFFTSTTRRTFALTVAPLLASGVYLVTAVQGALLLDRGWGLSDIAALQGAYAPLGGVLAGLTAGAAISRWGRSRPLLGIGGATMLSVAAVLPSQSETRRRVRRDHDTHGADQLRGDLDLDQHHQHGQQPHGLIGSGLAAIDGVCGRSASPFSPAHSPSPRSRCPARLTGLVVQRQALPCRTAAGLLGRVEGRRHRRRRGRPSPARRHLVEVAVDGGAGDRGPGAGTVIRRSNSAIH
ncbi:MFS transporter [Nocardia sp. NPDC004573]